MQHKRSIEKDRVTLMAIAQEQQDGLPQRKKRAPVHRKDLQELLLNLLSVGRLVTTSQWNYLANDWVTCIQAADIDNDSDTEIVIGGRDGYVRALTRQGTLLWTRLIGEGCWVTALAIVPDIPLQERNDPPLPRIIAATSTGSVYALDSYGNLLPDWLFQGKNRQMIRQLCIHPAHPNEIIVGSEDRNLYLLETATGNVRWRQPTKGRVYNACIADIDDDNHLEILVSATDKRIHIFNWQGKLRQSIELDYKSYILATLTPQKMAAKNFNAQEMALSSTLVLASSDGRNLVGWTALKDVDAESATTLHMEKIWPTSSEALSATMFKRRVEVMSVADINNDGQPEILLASADHILHIFDSTGLPLWKYDFGLSIHCLCCCDYDDDGITELLVALGDNSVRSLKIDLTPAHDLTPSLLPLDPSPGDSPSSLYQQIKQTVLYLRRQGDKTFSFRAEIQAELAQLDILQEQEPKIEKREFSRAQYLLDLGEYKEALAILMRLKEQKVQYYWEKWVTNVGHVRTLGFGDVQSNPIDEIILGNDEGYILALDINGRKEKILWRRQPQPGSSVVALQTGNSHEDGYEATLVVLDSQSIHMLDHTGTPQILPDTFLDSGDRVTSLAVTYEPIAGIHKIQHIILGLQENKIYVYDALFQNRLTIPTKKGVKALFACDVTGTGQIDIVAGLSDYSVRLFEQDTLHEGGYKELWSYLVQQRIRALHAADIDGDGEIEVLIGSDDRYLYVLNRQGNLKWRYFLPDSVLSIDVSDIDGDGNAELLVGNADGNVYFLGRYGDLRFRLPVHGRARVVRARDLHPAHTPYADGYVEIAVATDNDIMLFQVLRMDEVNRMIQECWRLLRKENNDRESLYRYADYHLEADPYIRAFALKLLAGHRPHLPKDVTTLQTAVKEDSSPIVSQALADAIVNLCLTSTKGENFNTTRQLLYRLSQKTHQGTKLAIVRMLGMLEELVQNNPELSADYLEELSFEYLERFLGNADLWLKQSVVRELYHLAATYPTQVARLLLISAHDDHLWIRQETGRALAHCFSLHPEVLFLYLPQLLIEGIDPAITQQMSISSELPALQQLFLSLTNFLHVVKLEESSISLDMLLNDLQKKEEVQPFNKQKELYRQSLEMFISALNETMQTIPQAEDMLVIYQELHNLLQVKTSSDIEQFHRLTSSEDLVGFCQFQYLESLFTDLLTVVHGVKQYRRRHSMGDKAATLIETTYNLSKIRNQFVVNRQQSNRNSHSPLPILLAEDVLICIALQHWHTLLRDEVRKLRGKADLYIELTSNDIQREESIELFFQLTNKGRCAADSVSISLGASNEYEIIGLSERTLVEISSNSEPRTISFLLKPFADTFRIETLVTYTDADGHKYLKQGHKIDLKRSDREYKPIVNPYHGGTPISDSSLFYGREEDLQSLSVILSGTTSQANRVILLVGQRRSGKTSLINQLVKKLSSHLAVNIDLQSMAMSNTAAELLAAIASTIHSALRARGFTPPQIEKNAFAENPTQVLDRYLELVVAQLAGLRLILLIDEFEVFNQLIRSNQLDPNFLHYLRSLMQHRLGINFLLAGAPRVLLDDLNNRSAFLNIAQYHHLSRLRYKEADQLIVEPVKKELTYDPLALERIHQLTSGQPYLIHLLSEILIQHCNQQHKNYANTNDVNIVLDTVLARGKYYFSQMWSLAASPIERFLLSLMAQDTDEGQGKIFSLADIQEAFLSSDLTYKHAQVRLALQRLKQEELIEERDDEGRLYIIPIGLIRAWLNQHKPFERVADEEEANIESSD